MASTYYNSELTAQEIEAALEAISGLIAPANNGKIVAIDDGTLVAKSASEYTDFDLQDKTATPGASQQVITPDSGYDGLSSVTINGDADLVAGNIKKNVNIFGVVGSYEGSGGSSDPQVDVSGFTPIYNTSVPYGNSGTKVNAVLTNGYDEAQTIEFMSGGWDTSGACFYDYENQIGAYAGYVSNSPIPADYIKLFIGRYSGQNTTLTATVQYMDVNGTWHDIDDLSIAPTISYPVNYFRIYLPDNVYGIRWIHNKSPQKSAYNNITFFGMLLFTGMKIKPKNITQPGTYNAKNEGYDGYNPVVVELALQEKNVTQNGIVLPDPGYLGLSKVSVSVSGGGGATILSGRATPTASIGSNGDIYLVAGAGIKNARGQYINTGYNGNSNSEYEITFILDAKQTGQYPTPFGARSRTDAVENASYFNVGFNYNQDVSYIGWSSFQPQVFNFGSNAMLKKVVHIELKAGICKITVGDEESTYTFTPSAITSTTPIGIFAMLINGDYQTFSPVNDMILIEFRILENGTLLHDFVPKLDGNNTPCVYDEIEEEYKYNGGSGSFTYYEDGTIWGDYVKVNGVWQSLIHSNIADINT